MRIRVELDEGQLRALEKAATLALMDTPPTERDKRDTLDAARGNMRLAWMAAANKANQAKHA